MSRKKRQRGPDPGLRRLRLWLTETHGRGARLAMHLGVSRGALYNWKRIPRDQIRSIHSYTGLPLHELAPDLYEEEP